jgi:hypothetical protein
LLHSRCFQSNFHPFSRRTPAKFWSEKRYINLNLRSLTASLASRKAAHLKNAPLQRCARSERLSFRFRQASRCCTRSHPRSRSGTSTGLGSS